MFGMWGSDMEGGTYGQVGNQEHEEVMGGREGVDMNAEWWANKDGKNEASGKP